MRGNVRQLEEPSTLRRGDSPHWHRGQYNPSHDHIVCIEHSTVGNNQAGNATGITYENHIDIGFLFSVI